MRIPGIGTMEMALVLSVRTGPLWSLRGLSKLFTRSLVDKYIILLFWFVFVSEVAEVSE